MSVTSKTSNERADTAATALRVFIDSGLGDIQDIGGTCSDLIAGILHFAKREGHEIDQVLNTSVEKFNLTLE